VDILRDLLHFLLGALGVVVVTTFLAHPDDGAAWRALPRRAAVFVGSCAVLALVLTVCGRVFASLGG